MVFILSKYKISVIIPVFNVEPYLKASLESLVNQTIGFENLEVIAVDDCSNDGSERIIDEYAEKYSNFTAIHLNENSGHASKPRNIGMSHATSDYVMFLNPDDEFVEDFCEVVYNKIVETGADVVKCNIINVVEEDCLSGDTLFVENKIYDNNVKELILHSEDKLLNFSVYNGIHNLNFIKKNNITFFSVISEDLLFSFEEWVKMDKMVYINDYFGYKYWNHKQESHSSISSKQNICSVIKCYQIADELFKKYGHYDLIPDVIGFHTEGTYSKISRMKRKDRVYFLKELYKNKQKFGCLNFQTIFYRFADKLLNLKLFNLTAIYLRILLSLSNSKFFVKISRKFINKID